MLVSVLSVLFILVCPLIIFIVLVQDPKGGGLAGVLGGAGGGSAFGAQTPKVVMKVTIGLGILFFAIALAMSFALKSTGEAVPSLQQETGGELPASLSSPLGAPAAEEPGAGQPAEVPSADNGAGAADTGSPEAPPEPSSTPAEAEEQ